MIVVSRGGQFKKEGPRYRVRKVNSWKKNQRGCRRGNACVPEKRNRANGGPQGGVAGEWSQKVRRTEERA